jgi:hypothetical protein
LAIYRDQTFAERRDSANAAKKALLEKFKSKPTADDPAVLAKQAERKAIPKLAPYARPRRRA